MRRFLLLTVAQESAAKCSRKVLQNVPRRSRCATYLRSHLRAVGGFNKKGFSRHYENKYERDLKLVGRIFCDGTSVGCQVAT